MAVILGALMLSGCGYNTLQSQDEQIKAAWGEVLNQYQRRADLIPNLVRTVEGFARQEREVLTRVTEARARVGAIQATPDLVNDPQAFEKFQQAQGELSGALSRLLVWRAVPGLKSDQNYDLQAQLRGTENRITVARNRISGAGLQHDGATVPVEPDGDGFRFCGEASFTVQVGAEISKPPEVKFRQP
jgi:LemA protein